MNMKKTLLMPLFLAVSLIHCEESFIFSPQDIAKLQSRFDKDRQSTQTEEFKAFELAMQQTILSYKNLEVALKDCQEKDNCRESVQLMEAFQTFSKAANTLNEENTVDFFNTALIFQLLVRQQK